MLMPDNYVTCPLDEAHRILRSRFQYHLVKCLKNHPLDKKLRCPWNATHIIDKFAYEDHWTSKCENLPELMSSAVCLPVEAPRLAAGVVSTPQVVPAEEDWDAEPYYGGTYDPMKNTESKPILRPISGLSKSQNKRWRQMERKRHQALVNEAPIPINNSRPKKAVGIDTEKIVRAAHSESIALSANASMLDNTRTSNTDELPRNADEIFDRSCASIGSFTDETVKLDNEQAREEKNIELPNQSIKRDATSRSSNISSHSWDASLKMSNSNKSFASVASAGTKPKEWNTAVNISADNSQNDDAGFPALTPIKSRSSKADRFVDSQLSGRFERIKLMSKNNDKESVASAPENSQIASKLENPKSNEAEMKSSGRTMPRCAANFEKFRTSEDKNTNPFLPEK